MALIYYPKSAFVSETVSPSEYSINDSSFKVISIDTSPGGIFYFNTDTSSISYELNNFKFMDTTFRYTTSPQVLKMADTSSYTYTSSLSLLLYSTLESLPSTPSEYGLKGFDAYVSNGGYLYIAVEDNQWRRFPISSWTSGGLYDQLVAWYSFDNSNNFGEDISDNDHDMTVIGSPLAGPSAVIGNSITGANFNNTNALRIENTFVELSTASWTAGCWANKNNYLPNGSEFFLWGQSNQLALTGACWRFTLTAAGNYYFRAYDNANAEVTHAVCGSTVDDNNWHFMAGTYNITEGIYRFYYDGGLVTTSNPSSPPMRTTIGNGGLSILSTYAGTDNSQGIIDECFLFTRCLSDTEIAQLYNSGSGTHPGL